MQNAKTKNTTSTVVKSAIFSLNHNLQGIPTIVPNYGITGKHVHAFINGYCGGQMANCYVYPTPITAKTTATTGVFTAIGNKGGKGKVASQLGGVRKAVQNWLIFGISPQHAKTYGGFNITKKSYNLNHILGSATKWGHTKTKPTCLLGLLNGGYSAKATSWGTGYVYLTNKPIKA